MTTKHHDCKTAQALFLAARAAYRGVVCAVFIAVLMWTAPAVAQNGGAQNLQNLQINACSPGQALLNMPVIGRDAKEKKLRAEMVLIGAQPYLWGMPGDSRCIRQPLRLFTGRNLLAKSGSTADVYKTDVPLPGPTLRARVGDLVEIAFLNHVNPADFAATLDLAEQGKTTGCDTYKGQPTAADWSATTAIGRTTLIQPTNNNAGGFYFKSVAKGTTSSTEPAFPQTVGQTVIDGTVTWTNIGLSAVIYPGGDKMPNCLHGSTTSNIHFHGTHTTPSTLGDNVLLYIRPALRINGKIEPANDFVKTEFDQIFADCEAKGTQTQWHQLPAAWRASQEKLIKEYDTTLPSDLPKLWPENQKEIDAGLWPQYQLGAYPYCFRLPEYKEENGKPVKYLMGQSPGTHWYHAHKHGSTALNVANGMAGILIIEGQYDDDLHKVYGKDLVEQVMIIQQLSATPFPLITTNPAPNGPGTSPKPLLSVNGRLQPFLTMRPGEVQLWRIANGAFRDAVQFLSFTQSGQQQPCSQTGSQAVAGPCIHWRQIAQDGVQLDFANYQTFGAQDRVFNLAPANRADLLVKAPTEPGTYALTVQPNETTLMQFATPPLVVPDQPVTLLTVKVQGNSVNPAQDFITNEQDFPKFPPFLNDIPEKDIFLRRTVTYGPGNSTINGQSFDPNHINQAMLLNTAEEWTIKNQADDKSHPFHIHVNPFQITEVFQANSQDATTPGNKCYADPLKPETWGACSKIPGHFVWWDTFAIPTGRNDAVLCTQSGGNYSCPSSQGGACNPTQVCTLTYSNSQTRTVACNQNQQSQWVCPTPPGVQGSSCGSQQACSVNIPGYFKMRTRFVDFTGEYVQHCHILIHEDRGMMQLLEVVPNTTLYTHH
ncbi:MAG TPA: multicopper oxidase domain-containing protein [Candidatus Angelobacter sp.]|nr:multicopper oxidase domain-containing protein [Candidatus Angelobacter sp.]